MENIEDFENIQSFIEVSEPLLKNKTKQKSKNICYLKGNS